MPLGTQWLDEEVATLHGNDRAIARLALLLAKAPYRVTEKTVEPVLHLAEEDFIRVLAWASCVASRRYIAIIKERLDRETARSHLACKERPVAEVATAG